MLRSIEELYGYTIHATDGEIGKVREFYFDDEFWTIRYLVLDTGGWLSGRQVLIAPAAFGQPDWGSHTFPLRLTKQEVEDSPPISADQPVSQQLQLDLHGYYGWPHYWAGTGIGMPFVVTPPRPYEEDNPGDPHLRSSREVIGYHIQAADDEIGHVEDFIVQDNGWVIRYMVVDTHNWLPGKKVLVATDWIEAVNWAERQVHVGLRRENIEEGPEFEPGMPVSRTYEQRLYDYYGRPVYWREKQSFIRGDKP
jgi:hypothetical protein